MSLVYDLLDILEPASGKYLSRIQIIERLQANNCLPKALSNIANRLSVLYELGVVESKTTLGLGAPKAWRLTERGIWWKLNGRGK